MLGWWFPSSLQLHGCFSKLFFFSKCFHEHLRFVVKSILFPMFFPPKHQISTVDTIYHFFHAFGPLGSPMLSQNLREFWDPTNISKRKASFVPFWSGQIGIIFDQPRFPWNLRGFPLPNHHLGEIGRVRSRWNLTSFDSFLFRGTWKRMISVPTNHTKVNPCLFFQKTTPNLVGGFNPFEKILVKMGIFPSPNRGENKKYLKPPPRLPMSIGVFVFKHILP